MEIISDKIRSIFIKVFYTNISESDIENILIDNFHRFAVDFQRNLLIVITWQGRQPGRWVNDQIFKIHTRITRGRKESCQDFIDPYCTA